MTKKRILFLITVISALLFSCKQKNIEGEKETESILSANKDESESLPIEQDAGYQTFPLNFPVDWNSFDRNIRFILDSGLKVTKNYYLKPSKGIQETFATGICHYSEGIGGNKNPCIILEPPKPDKIDFLGKESSPEELQAILDYLFPEGNNCIIEYNSDYADGGRKGAYVYKDSAFFDSFFTRDDPDYVIPSEKENLEPMPLVEKGFSIDDYYRTEVYCTFHGITISNGKIIYRIREDSDEEGMPFEVNYQFTHLDGMPFIKMEKPFPKEFLEANLYHGQDVNPDDKMLFLVCNTRDLGIQAAAITQGVNSSYMIIEPRWLEMSGRTYKEESSHLIEKGGKEYPVTNLCDMDSETPWVEGVPGNGIGESFVLENTWGTVYKTLLIMNGFISYEKPFLYKQNGRIKKIRVTGMVSGKEKVLDVLDTPHPQSVDISFITEPEDVRITIEEVYPGTKYDDTCIHFMINSLVEAVPYELSVK